MAGQSLLDATEATFKQHIGERTAILRAELDRVDAKVHERFLEAIRARAASCSLDEKLAALVDDYRAAAKAAGAPPRKVSLLEEEGEPPAQTCRRLESEIRAAAASADANTRACIEARTAIADDRGFLVAGILVDTDAAGKPALKPAIQNPGWVLLLWPQLITKWPGRKDSAVAILDPTEAPWKVRMALTLESKIETHSQAWKRRVKVGHPEYQRIRKEKGFASLPMTATEFLRARKNHGYFLLVDKKDDPLGWIDMDQCAFFQRDSEDIVDEVMKETYTKGVATALHGAVYKPFRVCKFISEGKPGTSADNSYVERACGDDLIVYDMLSLVMAKSFPDWWPLGKPPHDIEVLVPMKYVMIEGSNPSGIQLVTSVGKGTGYPWEFLSFEPLSTSLEPSTRADGFPVVKIPLTAGWPKEADEPAHWVALEELPRLLGR